MTEQTPFDKLLATLRPLTQKELQEIKDKPWFNKPLREEAYEVTGVELREGDIFVVTSNGKLLRIGSSYQRVQIFKSTFLNKLIAWLRR